MKKLLLILFLSFPALLCAQTEIYQLSDWVTDKTNTLSSEEISELDRELFQYSDTTSNQLVVLMIPTIGDNALESYAYETAAKNKIGAAKNNNGVLFLIAKDDRKMRLEIGYGLEGALPDALTSSILRNEVKPYFARNQYFEGIRSGIRAIKSAVAGEYKAPKKERRSSKGVSGIATIIIIFIFIIFNSIFRGRRGRGGFIFWGGSGGFGGGGGGFGGFGGGGGGGFSGGGGSFGGGGSSGSW